MLSPHNVGEYLVASDFPAIGENLWTWISAKRGWPAGRSCPGVQNLCDVGVVHEGKCLAFGLEAGEDLSGIHAGLHDLESDHA